MPIDASNRPSSRTTSTGGFEAAAIPRLTSQALLGRQREVVIEHAGREYRLRLTQNGKLILTA